MASNPVGAPSKLTPDVQRQICRVIRAGNTQQTAALSVGILPETLSNWKKEDRDFSVALKKAQAEFEMERVAFVLETGGWQASMRILEARQPDVYGRSARSELERELLQEEILLTKAKRKAIESGRGEDGGPIRIEVASYEDNTSGS